MTIHLTQHAADDLLRARDHHADVSAPLRDRFLADVDVAFERILMFPSGAPPVDGMRGLRRARLRAFPFGVFYRVENTRDILVVRVLHTRQDRTTEIADR